MPAGKSLWKKIQTLLDGPGALGSGDNGKVLAWNNATGRFEMTSLPAAVTPGGSTTQVQYNNAGAFAGDAGMTYDAANDALTLVGRLVAPVWRPAADGSAALQWQTAGGTAFVIGNTTDRMFGLRGTPSVMFDAFGTNGTTGFQFRNSTVDLYPVIRFTIDGNGGSLIDMFDYLKVQSARFYAWDGGDSYLVTRRFAIGHNAPTARLDVLASNSTYASLRIRAGSAVSSPNSGEIWYDTWLKFRRGSTTEQFATGVQAAGGAATAGGTYGATEQAMLQKIYDVGRAFGQLS